MQTDPEIVAQLVGSVTRSARKLGLRVDEPDVWGSGANLVVHLSPSPVVARIATQTAEMRHDPADYLGRERDVTTALTNLGLQVVVPTALVDPGPHRADGRSFLLMADRRLEPVDPTSPDHAQAVRRSLADLKRALVDLPPGWGQGSGTCRGLDVDTDRFVMAWHHEVREVYALLWNWLYAQRDHRANAATTERLESLIVRDELARGRRRP